MPKLLCTGGSGEVKGCVVKRRGYLAHISLRAGQIGKLWGGSLWFGEPGARPGGLAVVQRLVLRGHGGTEHTAKEC